MQLYTKLGQSFTGKEAILGTGNQSLNYVLMMANKFIYQRKFLELNLSLEDFTQSLKSIRKVEEDIATRHMRAHKHDQKWNSIVSTGIFN